MQDGWSGFTSLRATLLASSFLFQMLTSVVGITVPIYAVHLGASPFIVGAIGASGGAIYSFMPAVSGILSDRFGRKTFIYASTILYGISCLLYLSIRDPRTLVPVKALETFSAALFWPSLEALLIEASTGRVEESLQKFNLSWGTGMIIGPALGGFMISMLGLGAPFLTSSILSFTLFLVAVIAVSEVRTRGRSLGHDVLRSYKRLFSSIPDAVISTVLLSFAAGIIFGIFPAYASSLGIPAYEIGLLGFLIGMFRLLAFLWAYRLEGALGRINIFLVGSILMALALALTAAGRTAQLFAVSLSMLGFSIGLLYAASIASFLSCGRGVEGRAAGLFECLLGVGYLLGPLLGGFAAEFSPEAPYIIASLFASSTIALYLPRRAPKA